MKKNYLSILLSYNDDNITELLTTIIETRYNSKIDIAKHDAEFFEFTNASKYDVILMDNSFCKDAFKVISRFRRENAHRNTPIALFISHITEESYKRAIALDVFDFLSRPFSLDHIYLCLDYILLQKGHAENIKNKRRTARYEKRYYMKYNIRGKEAISIPSEHLVTTEDISLTGIKFSDNTVFSKNDELELEIMLGNPYDSSKLKTLGQVKWAKQTAPDNYTVGVEFLLLSQSDEAMLRSTLHT